MSESGASAKQRHYERKSPGYSAGRTRSDRVLSLVGGPGLRVLDVACGSGHLGAQIRERGNTVVGTELSESAAAEARKVLTDVHVFDLEAPWPQSLEQEPFDVIVLGEILEHTFDPTVVLTQAGRLLRPGGRVVITTPNFLVWIARLQVLFGRFRYQRYGLFDFGHIRWFTYDYLQQVVRDAGFSIEREAHIAHPARMAPLVGTWPALLALHFVVSARKARD